jgi:hypothetical protein
VKQRPCNGWKQCFLCIIPNMPNGYAIQNKKYIQHLSIIKNRLYHFWCSQNNQPPPPYGVLFSFIFLQFALVLFLQSSFINIAKDRTVPGSSSSGPMANRSVWVSIGSMSSIWIRVWCVHLRFVFHLEMQTLQLLNLPRSVLGAKALDLRNPLLKNQIPSTLLQLNQSFS